MAEQYQPGDVIIESCTITSRDGKRTLDIRPQVTWINIYEAITQPVITGTIDIFDSINLLGGFPLLGEEVIELKYQTAGKDKVSFKLYVTRISSVTISENKKGKSYVIHVASLEAIKSNASFIEKRIKGNISDQVLLIVRNELSSSKPFVFVEPTIGIEDHLVAKMTPLEAIDKLRHRAISPTYKSSSFCFFETSRGFSFVTMEQLIRQNSVDAADRAFFYDETHTIDVAQTTFRDIIGVDYVQQQDTLSAISHGGLSNNVKRFNLITGQMEDVGTKVSELDDSFQKTAPTARTNTTAFLAEYQQSQSVRTLFPDGTGDQGLQAEKMGKLRTFVEKIMQNVLRIHVYGDSSITAGDIINCNITSASGLTVKDKTTKSNNYLVAKVRHMILNSHRPKYTQSFELISNGFEY